MKNKIKRKHPAFWLIRHRSGNIRDHPQRYHINVGKRYGNFRQKVVRGDMDRRLKAFFKEYKRDRKKYFLDDVRDTTWRWGKDPEVLSIIEERVDAYNYKNGTNAKLVDFITVSHSNSRNRHYYARALILLDNGEVIMTNLPKYCPVFSFR